MEGSTQAAGDGAERRLRDVSSQVTKRLGGPGDFRDWSWCMKLLFEEQGVLKVVTGETPQPREFATDEVRSSYARLN